MRAPLPRDYYNNEVTVIVGAANQEVDLAAALDIEANPRWQRLARYLHITTDVALTMRINKTTADLITVDTTDGITLPVNAMEIEKLYFTHPIASSALGTATVVIFAT